MKSLSVRRILLTIIVAISLSFVVYWKSSGDSGELDTIAESIQKDEVSTSTTPIHSNAIKKVASAPRQIEADPSEKVEHTPTIGMKPELIADARAKLLQGYHEQLEAVAAFSPAERKFAEHRWRIIHQEHLDKFFDLSDLPTFEEALIAEDMR